MGDRYQRNSEKEEITMDQGGQGNICGRNKKNP